MRSERLHGEGLRLDGLYPRHGLELLEELSLWRVLLRLPSIVVRGRRVDDDLEVRAAAADYARNLGLCPYPVTSETVARPKRISIVINLLSNKN